MVKKNAGKLRSIGTIWKRSKTDIIYDGVIFTILTILFVLVAYPLYFVIIASISDPIAVTGGDVVFFPVGFTFDGYMEVFEHDEVMRGFVNSLIITVVGVMVNLLITIPTSYALSRTDFKSGKYILFFYMITMFVSGGMMPTYLIVRDTHLLGTWWALIIPGAISVFNMIVARTFFKTNISKELLEAARLDGCGNTRFFVHIALPLSSAIIAILVLYYGIGHWNSYFSALLYLNERELWPLQLVLRNILVLNSMNTVQQVMSEAALAEKERLDALADMMKYSLIIVSSIPVLILYPFIQKHFVAGVTIGSVKG